MSRKTLVISLAVMSIFLLPSKAIAAKPSSTCKTIQSGLLQDVKGNPINIGYDKWGYNYEAHMFNGFYDNNTRPTDPVTSGDRLMMKWNDAWLSNSSCDGDNTLDRPTNYIGSGAWLTNHASGTYAGDTYNVTSNYVVRFEYLGSYYDHDLSLTEDSLGALTGFGGYPNGGPYSYQWNLTSGTVTGSSISFDAIYTGGPDAVGTIMHVTGTVAADGSMSGDWSDNYLGQDRHGTWSTISGKGTVNVCTWSDFVKVVAVPANATLDSGTWKSADGTVIGPEIWGSFAIIQEISDNPCGKDLGLTNFRSALRSGLGNW